MSNKRFALTILWVCAVAAIVYGLTAQPTQASDNGGPLVTWGPDLNGVVCYSKSGTGGSNPLSCVKVY